MKAPGMWKMSWDVEDARIQSLISELNYLYFIYACCRGLLQYGSFF